MTRSVTPANDPQGATQAEEDVLSTQLLDVGPGRHLIRRNAATGAATGSSTDSGTAAASTP
jgi:hypothetical protein